jgi:hypothetical protein
MKAMCSAINRKIESGAWSSPLSAIGALNEVDEHGMQYLTVIHQTDRSGLLKFAEHADAL